MVSRDNISDRFINVCNILITIGEVRSMQECADRLGTYPHVLSKIQKKIRSVPIEILLKMINKFNVRPGYLFGETSGANVFYIRDSVQAGLTMSDDYEEVFNNEHGLKSLRIDGLRGHKWVFTVDGISMLPTIEEGDLLVCERINSLEELKLNSIYVIVTTGKPMVKRVEVIKSEDILILNLKSDNPDEPTISMEISNEGFIQFYEVKSRIIEQIIK